MSYYYGCTCRNSCKCPSQNFFSKQLWEAHTCIFVGGRFLWMACYILESALEWVPTIRTPRVYLRIHEALKYHQLDEILTKYLIEISCTWRPIEVLSNGVFGQALIYSTICIFSLWTLKKFELNYSGRSCNVNKALPLDPYLDLCDLVPLLHLNHPKTTYTICCGTLGIPVGMTMARLNLWYVDRGTKQRDIFEVWTILCQVTPDYLSVHKVHCRDVCHVRSDANVSNSSFWLAQCWHHRYNSMFINCVKSVGGHYYTITAMLACT